MTSALKVKNGRIVNFFVSLQIDVALNGKIVEELTHITHITKARETGTQIVSKLKDSIPRQMFLVAIQAKVGSKVLARADVKPFRKDVLAKCVSLVISLIIMCYFYLKNKM